MSETQESDPLRRPVIGAAFNRLFKSALAEDIGLFALEEHCVANFVPGMTAKEPIASVRASAA